MISAVSRLQGTSVEDKVRTITEARLVEDAEHHRLVLYLFGQWLSLQANPQYGGNFVEDRK